MFSGDVALTGKRKNLRRAGEGKCLFLRLSSRFLVFALALLIASLIFPGRLLAATINATNLNSGGTITLTTNNEIVTVTGSDQINTTGWNTLKALSSHTFSLVLNNGSAQTEIPSSAMSSNIYITSFTADYVTSIGNQAFDGCTSLALTSLPSSVTTIGGRAFYGCTSLALTGLHNGVTSIGTQAFAGCTSLALTSLPNSVTSIGDSVFQGCTSLALMSLPSGLTSIGAGAFRDCTSLTSFTANSVTSIGIQAFMGCTSLALTSLPSGLTSIGDSAFEDCTSLALTSLPSGVTSIDAGAFEGCTSLVLTNLPSGLTSIGYRVFKGCTSLALTSLPGGLTSIGFEAFSGCTSLALTNLPSGVTSIDVNAFNGCTSLVWLDMSSCTALATIGHNAFQNCTLLATVAMPRTLPTTIGDYVFYNTAPGLVFLVPDTTEYTNWLPTTGTKIYITDGTLVPTGTASVSYGGNISLSCGNVPGATYQWEKETSPGVWTPISGATGRTYTKNGAATSDSGIYRCVITRLPASFKNSITITVGTGLSHTVTFDSQGGGAVTPITVPDNSTITAPAVPTRAGYSFGGWYKEAACTNAWDFAADTVTGNITLYAKWQPGAPAGSVESIDVSGFPLTLEPGKSFEVTLIYPAVGGGAPDPEPVLSFSLDSASAALVSVDILSSNSARVTALPQDTPINGTAPSNSAVYGEAHINFIATQTIGGSAYQKSAVCTLVIADDLATPVELTPEAIDEFNNANMELVSSDEYILPGNIQPPITSLNRDWQLIEGLNEVRIAIEHPVPDVLPVCFKPTGKDAADIRINVKDLVSPDKKALLPLTFRVTVRSDDLVEIFDASLAQQILASPRDHLDAIFTEMLLQKEILEGERAGWYTRLVDGVLKPQEAVDKGILEITGGETLTLNLSYYVLDDSVLEAFEQDGYLIVPDGAHNNEIVDPIWLNMWDGDYAPGDNTMQGSGGSGSEGGGGCSSGLVPLVLLALASAALLKKTRRD